MNIRFWFPLGLTGLTSLLSKGISSIFSSPTIQKHQFFSTQPSLWSNSHIHTWPLEKPQLWLYGSLSALLILLIEHVSHGTGICGSLVSLSRSSAPYQQFLPSKWCMSESGHYDEWVNEWMNEWLAKLSLEPTSSYLSKHRDQALRGRESLHLEPGRHMGKESSIQF